MLISEYRKHDRQYFYKYTTANTAKIILVNKTLRFCSPQLFNDPFDVTRKLRLPVDSEELSGAVVTEFANLIRTGSIPTDQYNPRLCLLLEYTASLTEKQRQSLSDQLSDPGLVPKLDQLPSFRELEDKWKWFIPRFRILSFTEEHDNTVMWSSYSDAYKGVVLELECLDIYDSAFLLARPVIYSDELPVVGTLNLWVRMLTGQASFDYQEMFGKLEYIKSTRWQYEKEWRVSSFEKNSSELFSDYKMNPRTFTKVFFGKDVSEQDRKDLLDLLVFDLSHVEAYEMLVDDTRGRLQFARIK
jgi:Protein of unknown function (DUF2971).